ANYGFDLGPGHYRIGFSGTRNLERRVIAQRGTAGTDNAGQFQYPDFKASLRSTYEVGNFSAGLTTRYISSSLYAVNDQSLETREMPYVPEYWQHDLNLTWYPATRYSVSLGVKNLTDSKVKHPVLQAYGTSPHLTADTVNANNGAAYMDGI